MITGELKSKVDDIWNTMWSGGVSNLLTVIEQLTYLLFSKRLDELHTLKERNAARTGKSIEDPVFSKKQEHLRWSRFKESAPEQMFATVKDEIFPFIKALGSMGDEEGTTYSHHMKDALFIIPTPKVLANVVDKLDGIDMIDPDTEGDLYTKRACRIKYRLRAGGYRSPEDELRSIQSGMNDAMTRLESAILPAIRELGV